MSMKAEIIERLGKGLNDRQVANQVGCSIQAVFHWRKELGMEAVHKRGPKDYYLADARNHFVVHVHLRKRTAECCVVSALDSAIETVIPKSDRKRRVFDDKEQAERWARV